MKMDMDIDINKDTDLNRDMDTGADMDMAITCILSLSKKPSKDSEVRYRITLKV
jgi:hypothetical protein